MIFLLSTAELTAYPHSNPTWQFIDPDLDKRTVGKKGGTRAGKGTVGEADNAALFSKMYPAETRAG